MISIIIPAFNTAKYLPECLDSILNQKYKDYEIIIIDDGSTDETARICDEYKRFKEISVYHTDNSGVSNARNLGIEKAKGDYVWFVDSDDIVKTDSLKTIAAAIRSADLVSFGFEKFDKKQSNIIKYSNSHADSKSTTRRMLSDDDLRGYLFNKVFRLSVIKENNLRFDGSIRVCEDLLFCVEYANHIKQASIIDAVLYGYRQRRGGAIFGVINKEQSTALDAFMKIYDLCEEAETQSKAAALFTKAYYKYRFILTKQQAKKYRQFLKKAKSNKSSFSSKDKLLIFGYRFLNPIMRLAHLRVRNNPNLFDSERDNNKTPSNPYLLFFVFLSFYLGTIHLGAITPLVVTGGIAFVYNLFKRASLKRHSITLVEISYFCFVAACALLSLFSYDKIESVKQIIKIIALIFIFWQFIVLFRSASKDSLHKSFTAASLVFFAITTIMYIGGLISLGFNFNVENIDILGVTIDRNMPRLISLAYNDPNITALYLSVPFTYFLSSRSSKINRLGLIFSLILIGLTVSRGAYISLVPVLILFAIFGKNKLKSRLLSVSGIIVCLGLSFISLVGLTALNQDGVLGNPSASDDTTSINSSSDTNSADVNVNAIAPNPITKHFDFKAGSGSGRLPLWNRAIETIKKRPLTGVGLNNTYVYTEAEYGKGKYVHNTYLEIAMEEGIIGGALYLLVVVAICITCWQLRKKCLFPALLFCFLFCAQIFLSVSYSEVFFAGILVLALYGRGFILRRTKERA